MGYPPPTRPLNYRDPVEFYIGIFLAIISTVFIGASFVIKKTALLRHQGRGYVRANAGGYGYLREWVWWAGLLSMGVGEAANFAAYAFAPASLVTPLGALSVLVSSLLASKFLKERLNLIGKLGCLLCIVGSTVIVIHAPKEDNVVDLEELELMLGTPVFLSYIGLVVLSSIIISCHLGPRYGKRHVSVYIFLCSSIGSLSVMSCKGLGLALKETFGDHNNELDNWITWLFLFSVIICIVVQMNYLNKALDTFSTGIVTPVYYVFFTGFVILASCILFDEWYYMCASDIVGTGCGFTTVVIGISLLNGFKGISITMDDISSSVHVKPKESSHSIRFQVESDEEALIQHYEGYHSKRANR